MKKITKLLLTIPLAITPIFLCSCVSQKEYNNSKEETKKAHEENLKLKHEIETNEEHNRKIENLKEEIEQLRIDNKRKDLELKKLGIKK